MALLLLDVDDHLFMYVCVADDLAELLKVDLAVVVPVCEENSLIHYLLQLRVLQIGAHHHLEHLEELAVADVPVVVDVVDPATGGNFVWYVKMPTTVLFLSSYDASRKEERRKTIVKKSIREP